jgi:hypothetical protein
MVKIGRSSSGEPYLMVGRLNTFVLWKDRRYGTCLVVEWWGKDLRVWTFPRDLFARDLYPSCELHRRP